jgi:hypothetical protein
MKDKMVMKEKMSEDLEEEGDKKEEGDEKKKGDTLDEESDGESDEKSERGEKKQLERDGLKSTQKEKEKATRLEETDPATVKVSSEHRSGSVILAPIDDGGEEEQLERDSPKSTQKEEEKTTRLEETDTATVKVSSEHRSGLVILAPLDISVGKDGKKNRGDSDKEVKEKKKQSKAL